MKATKKVVQEIIAKIVASVGNTAEVKLQLAKDLYWARYVINWRMTDYGGWEAFYKQHIKLGNSTIWRYITLAEVIAKYKYTDEECFTIIEAVGWCNFMYGMFDLTRKVAVKTFISKYTSASKKGPTRYRKGGDRAYTFSLPTKEADIYDLHLVNYGMSMHDKGRRGVRDAMIRLVNHKLK